MSATQQAAIPRRSQPEDARRRTIVVTLEEAMFDEVRALVDGSGESLGATVRTLIRLGLDNLDPGGPLAVVL